jgi:hypothetical protein
MSSTMNTIPSHDTADCHMTFIRLLTYQGIPNLVSYFGNQGVTDRCHIYEVHAIVMISEECDTHTHTCMHKCGLFCQQILKLIAPLKD